MAKEKTRIQTSDLAIFIANYRNSKAWSQEQLAEILGVSRITIARWENNESLPSVLALKQLQGLLTRDPELNVTLTIEKDPSSDTTEDKRQTTNRLGKVILSPYVINGPKDQNEFHYKLIQMQEPLMSSKLSTRVSQSRISLAQTIDDQPTSQNLLEHPKQTAKAWNSNYGPHGWHRYVGRFPPHLVRALLNYFQATPSDTICDPFAGSGTTLVESRLLGIPSVGIEICPLSCLISKTKTSFTPNTNNLKELITGLTTFYKKTEHRFTKRHGRQYEHKDVLARPGNNIQDFPNIEKWFTPEALLGVSIITEFAISCRGYNREAILTALSAKMRSIGNIDVDVVRAEYSKQPRKNVDALKLVSRQLLKMVNDIERTFSSHQLTLADKTKVKIIQGSTLDIDLGKNSISHIVTSPPYGVESLSYLRTHLLSYRSLGRFLKEDPYQFGDKVIGSEYLAKDLPKSSNLAITKIKERGLKEGKGSGTFFYLLLDLPRGRRVDSSPNVFAVFLIQFALP